MAAMSICVQKIPTNEDDKFWKVDCVQWPRQPLLDKDPRFRCVPLSACYLDYVAVFSIDEALELNRQYLNDHENNRILQQKLEETKKPESMILARMYEWESGLGD